MPPSDDELNSFPQNNFPLSALILAGLIIVIGLAYAFGIVQP